MDFKSGKGWTRLRKIGNKGAYLQWGGGKGRGRQERGRWVKKTFAKRKKKVKGKERSGKVKERDG